MIDEILGAEKYISMAEKETDEDLAEKFVMMAEQELEHKKHLNDALVKHINKYGDVPVEVSAVYDFICDTNREMVAPIIARISSMK